MVHPWNFGTIAASAKHLLHVGWRNTNIRNREGHSLVSSAIDKFISPLAGVECVQLLGKDFQKLKDNLLWSGSRYNYNYLIKHYAMVWTVIPEIIADAAAVPPVVSAPEKIVSPTTLTCSTIIWIQTLSWHANTLHSPGAINLLQSWRWTPLTIEALTVANAAYFVQELWQKLERTSFWKECIPSSLHIKSWSCWQIQLVRQLNSTVIFSRGSLRTDTKKRWMVWQSLPNSCTHSSQLQSQYVF